MIYRYLVRLAFVSVLALTLSGCDLSLSVDDKSESQSPTLTVNDNSTFEGDSGRKSLNFTVNLNKKVTETVSVDYSLTGIQATVGSDFVDKSGTLKILSGELSAVISVEIIGDNVEEEGETFSLNLSNPVNASLTDNQAIGTIIDDDGTSNPGVASLNISDSAVSEGDSGQQQLIFVVTTGLAISVDISVEYQTGNQTATVGDDYEATTGTLTIPAGETSGLISIAVNGDTDTESNEYFTITLSSPMNIVLGGNSHAIGTILDDDMAPPPPLDPGTGVSAAKAGRFLAQASFGATQVSIDELVALDSLDQWIEQQFAKPLGPLQLPYVDAHGDNSKKWFRHDIWWKNVVESDDQLRQRVAFALSQIFVISDNDYTLRNSQLGVASYHDMLYSNAFGNYRDLLEKVTLHPVMGIYLSMIQNEKADQVRNIRPDENYAREVMQLFSIGLYELNIDGTPRIGSDGRSVPSYSQDDIEEFAKVYTGWSFKGTNWNHDAIESDTNLTDPLEAWQEHHDIGEKYLLNSVILAAGQTAEVDLQQALDNIFYHQNVGPFISKLLIQRLVSSNPSPAYVARVAQYFNNNGDGERGDLKAVIKAILLDEEAREGHINMPTTFGKLREPLMRFSHLWRAFNAIARDGVNNEQYFVDGISTFEGDLGQAILRSPSVFNFYLPEYSPPGELQNAGLFGPEFQIATEGNLVNTNNLLHEHIYRFNNVDERINSSSNGTLLDLESEALMASNIDTLLDYLNKILLASSMSDEFRQNLKAHLVSITADSDVGINRVKDAIFMIMTSPEYLIQQ